MPEDRPKPLTVLAALEQSDALVRQDRADRLAWLSQFMTAPPVIMGRHEPLAILEEARVCYVNGQNIAAVILATAFIEHTLVEELELAGLDVPKTFAATITAVRKASLLPTDLLDNCDRLRLIRNPLSHKRDENDEHRLPIRSRREQRPPWDVIEEDAKLAIETMYGCFHRTIREWNGLGCSPPSDDRTSEN